MKFSKIVFFLFWMLLFFVGQNLESRNVGSNTTSSRQLKTFFPTNQSDNQMVGFSVFEKGLMLEDIVTTCSYDAFFPISGNVVLNGGTLILLRDAELKSPFSIGSGMVDGKGQFALEFPGNVSGINIPSTGHEKLLSMFYNEDMIKNVYSVDWSFDNKYIAVAHSGSTSYDEIKLYYVDDLSLTLTLTKDFGSSHAFAVRWHPSDYYLAVGRSSDDELEIYYFNISDGTLTKKDGVSTSDVTAVSWEPDGEYLAVGRSSNSEIIVYEIENGILGTSYSATYSSYPSVSRTVQKNALDWDSTGSYLAVGLNSSSSDSELKVFCFTGTAVYEYGEIEIGSTAYSVGWHPDDPYLAVGVSCGSERLLLYEHDVENKEFNIVDAGASVSRSVYGLRWMGDGSALAAVMDASSLTYDLAVFSFNSSNMTLNLAAGYRAGHDLKAVTWSSDGTMVATGDYAEELKVFHFTSRPLVFKDINIFLKSDVTFRGPVIFEGTCLINGGGNVFEFDSNGAIIVADGGTLLLEDAFIRGIGANDIACMDNSSVLTLRDVVWQQDSIYTFSVGALHLKDNIIMSGDTTFVYSSSVTSTLFSKSELELDVGFTFSYDPGINSQKLFDLEDNTSKLVLNGATIHSTVTGMQLTKGNLRIARDSFLASETQDVLDIDGKTRTINQGISFGDGILNNDLTCDIYSGVTLTLSQGALSNRNVSSSSCSLHNITSTLYISGGARLNLYESMNLGVGVLVFGDKAILARAAGKDVVGSIRPLGRLYKAGA